MSDPGVDRASRTPWLVAGFAGIVVAVCAALAVFGVAQLSHSSSSNDDRAAALSAGGQLAVDFSSVDYSHLGQFCAANATHATASFAASCRKEVKTLSSLFTSSKVPTVVSSSEVQRTGLQSYSPSTAKVLVALQENVRTGAAKSGTVQDVRVQVDLVKQHGDWLINGLSQL